MLNPLDSLRLLELHLRGRYETAQLENQPRSLQPDSLG